MKKQEKGITLIALIITIVVLMILAVVTINSVKDEGIITHAQNAAQKYNEEKKNEQEKLASIENEINKYINKWWLLTEEEKTQMPIDSAGQRFVAMNSNEIGTATKVIVLFDDLTIAIVDVDGNEFYYFTWNEEITVDNIEAYKWYHGKDTENMSDFVKYIGVSPIAKEEFENGVINSESYLQKIIDSFNE